MNRQNRHHRLLLGSAACFALLAAPRDVFGRWEDPAVEEGGVDAPRATASLAGPQDEGEGLPPGEPPSRVTLSLTPYAWLTSFSGDATIRGIEFDVDLSFSDVIEESDTVVALMGAVDVAYDRFVFQFNGAWSSVQASGSRGTFPAGSVSADLDMSMGWFEFMGGYRFLDRAADPEGDSARRLTADAFVGVRLTTIDVDATLTTEFDVTLPDGEVLMAGDTRERSVSEEWAEPFVGARLGYDLTEHWSLSVRGDIGGFGVSGADFAWQTTALVGYRWRHDGWSVAAFGGYRALGQDYSSGGFGWELITHGPLLGVQCSFAF